MSHDPLYEITPEDKLAIRIITAVGALLAFMAVGYALGGGWGAREKTPAESPPAPGIAGNPDANRDRADDMPAVER